MNILERTDGVSGSGFKVYRVSPLLAWYGADNVAHAQAVAAAAPLRPMPRKSKPVAANDPVPVSA